METVSVLKSDLIELLIEFDSFIETDRDSNDSCKFCSKGYGNADQLVKSGGKITHNKDCSVLIAQDMSTRL